MRTAVRREFAFIPAKKQTDLILNATAFSPDNLPHTRWQCAIQVQSAQGEVRLEKTLQVTGPRHWTRTLGIWSLTEPKSCTQVPLRYELAFGGELIKQGQDAPGDPWQVTSFAKRPRDKGTGTSQGRYPAPRIEDPQDPVTDAGRTYTPQGFGCIHSSWTPRRNSAQAAENPQADAGAPRNCAHPDLIVPGDYLNGDETLQLDHLLPGPGRQTVKLPGHRLLWRIRRQDGIDIYGRPNLDTVELDIDTPREAWRVTLSWRAQLPISRDNAWRRCCSRRKRPQRTKTKQGRCAMGNKEGARQSVRPVVVCPNKTIDLSRSVAVSPNVRFTGEYAFIMSSTVIDGKDSCVPIESSTTVRCNGKYVIRDGDKFLVNGSCIGVLVYVEGNKKAESLQERTTPPDVEASLLDDIWGGAKQVGGFFVGAGKAAGELVEFGVKGYQYFTDHTSTLAPLVDMVFDTPPAWLPSRARGTASTETIQQVGQAVWNDPWLIWEGIKAPYVEAWAQGRYGEAIGRGTFEIITSIFGAKGADKLGKLGSLAGKLNKAEDIADVLTVAKRADASILAKYAEALPTEFSGIADELINARRAGGQLDNLVDGARQAGALDDVLALGKLTPDEIDHLKDLGKLTNAEAKQAKLAFTKSLRGVDGVRVTKKAPEAENAAFGKADTDDYKKTFFDENPDLKGDVVVHHSVEQQSLKRYPDIVSKEEIHSLENLRGIPKEVNSDIHLSKIRKEWNKFYRETPSPTKEMLLEQATKIDSLYGDKFNPPVR